jgi:hypothetical protein
LAGDFCFNREDIRTNRLGVSGMSKTKIYVQSHILGEEGYLPKAIPQNGKGKIGTNKSFITNEKNWGLLLLITSGKRCEYLEFGFPEPELLPEIDKTIYFLWQKFHIEEVFDLDASGSSEECVHGIKYKFAVCGKKRARTFNTPFLLLNDRPYFEEFASKFLRTGLTNIAKQYPPDPPFLKTLLEISKEKPFYVFPSS